MWSPLTRRYSFAGFCRDLTNGSTFLTVHRPTVCCGVIWLWGSQCAACGSSVSLILLAWPTVYGHYESISSCLSHLSHVSGYHGSHWANPLKAFHTRVIISSAAVAVPGAELEESETRWEQLCHLLVFNFLRTQGWHRSPHSSILLHPEDAQCSQSVLEQLGGLRLRLKVVKRGSRAVFILH